MTGSKRYVYTDRPVPRILLKFQENMNLCQSGVFEATSRANIYKIKCTLYKHKLHVTLA